jgi:hypothetical protein
LETAAPTKIPEEVGFEQFSTNVMTPKMVKGAADSIRIVITPV